ncbi:hypothetical protein F5Y10DRAFT_275428 [Nemania abortiva]|nr:hypothetical protein F5Y10DRAFT_275428 [Nemania abortiva]
MFTCAACLRRAFYTLSGHSLPKNLNTSRYNLPSHRTIAKPSRLSRRYATVAPHTSSGDATTGPIAAPISTRHGENNAPVLGRSAQWAVRKELEYLGDPLHIANRVRLALDKDNLELAAGITRQASKSTNVTVSWNHLIDYQLQKGRLHPALKLYNEMKKRAQLPNAQTFTILFRGFARSEHPKLAVAEAVKLYQNMLSVGRIKPNTIHLNAVLQVCAKAGDLESMFSILSSSDDPLRSPNNLTYTTILNAMRMNADKDPTDNDPSALSEKEIQKEKQSAIKRAKAIWEEVVSRWKSGSLIIDEELVCAMGRILLLGGYTDIDSIEGLIEQTMLIPRAEDKSLSEGEGSENTALAVPKPKIRAPGAPAISHALPGNNSLSMILEALEKTRKTTKAIKYWSLFTVHYHVVPDADNWTRALRVFRRGKNSGRAATILQDMPSDMITPKHIRLAMKTCLRDNLNKSAFDNATVILNTMGRIPSVPDAQSLRTYLQVAHATKRSFDRETKDDYAGAMDAWAKNLAVALEHLYGPYQVLAKKYVIDPPNPNDRTELERARHFYAAEVIALARKMRAAYDILTTEHFASLTAAQVAKIRPRLASLTRFINDYLGNDKQRREQAGRRENAEDNKPRQRHDTRRRNSGGWEHANDKAFEQSFEQKFSNRMA